MEQLFKAVSYQISVKWHNRADEGDCICDPKQHFFTSFLFSFNTFIYLFFIQTRTFFFFCFCKTTSTSQDNLLACFAMSLMLDQIYCLAKLNVRTHHHLDSFLQRQQQKCQQKIYKRKKETSTCLQYSRSFRYSVVKVDVRS